MAEFKFKVKIGKWYISVFKCVYKRPVYLIVMSEHQFPPDVLGGEYFNYVNKIIPGIRKLINGVES